MRTNKFKIGLLSAAAVLGLGVFSSCSKDFQGDIDGINNRIDKLTTSLDEVKSGLKDGKAITDVVAGDNGVVIKMSDGKQYTITNGKDGEDGTVIKIGDDGFWYIGGVKTEYPAKGIKGEKGDKGDAGVYYEPNKDGYWYKVDPAKGDKGVKTEMKWLPEGTITAVYENGVVTLYNVKGYEGGLKLGSIAITKLTAIADVVADKGGALPLVDFSPLKTNCGTITPTVTVKYLVSPMNATIDQIESVDFLYNNPKVADTRSIDDAIKSTAEIVTLEKGILTVKAGVDASKLGKKPGTMDQINLLVTLKSGQTITSDWVKVTADKTLDGSIIALALKNKEANYPAFPKTLVDAKKAAENLSDPSIIELEYSSKINLKDTVIARLGKDLEKLKTVYGLDNITFDLLDGKGKAIEFTRGTNKTDQQKFIVLDGSTISTRVYDLDGANPASIDRTPIVHVALTTTKDGKPCVVAEGFIVIKIVKDKTPEIPPTIINADDSFVLGCGELKQLVGTKQMNEEIYGKARLPKADFHKVYTWSESTVAGEVGTIVEKKVNNEGEAESYNLEWTVTEDEAWKALGDEDSVVIKKSGQYTDKTGQYVIKVTFTATLNRPYVDLQSLKIKNYWFDAEGGNSNMVKFNTAVPDLGSTDASKCTFKTYFASVLKSDKAKKKVNISGITPSVTKLDRVLFTFAKDQDFSDAFDKDGYTMVPSGDGLTLNAVNKAGQTFPIAVIDNDPEGQTIEYMNNDVAKKLLNKGAENVHARIALKAINDCGKELQIRDSEGTFIVKFLRPVSMTPQSAKPFVDAVDYGAKGSFIDVHELANLYDWRKYMKESDEYYFEKHPNYYQFYGVKSINVNVDEIKVENLKIEGVEDPTLDDAGIELTQMAPTAKMIETYPELKNTSADGLLMYKNNGAALKEHFFLILPVTVEYKWGMVVENVRVEVMPTDKTSPAAR